MSNEVMKREIGEAITAGERALTSLKAAQSKLNSAKNWGIYDMFGGGFIASMIKRSKMDDASAYMEAAKHDLEIFQRELQDVCVPLDLKMEIGGFLTFADFFFDGFVADYLVQSKISDTRRQLADAVRRVENILRDLRIQYGGV